MMVKKTGDWPRKPRAAGENVKNKKLLYGQATTILGKLIVFVLISIFLQLGCRSAEIVNKTENEVSVLNRRGYYPKAAYSEERRQAEVRDREESRNQAIQAAREELKADVEEVGYPDCKTRNTGIDSSQHGPFYSEDCLYNFRKLVGTETNTLVGLSREKNPEKWPAVNEMARQQIAAGSDANMRDNEGATPLHNASANGNLSLANFLIGAKADVNARNTVGKSVIASAAENSNAKPNALAIVKALISAGAETHTILDSQNASAEIVMEILGKEKKESQKVVNCFAWTSCSTAMLQPLLEIDKNTGTGILFTCSKNSKILCDRAKIELIIKYGAKINQQDSEGNTPLMHAASSEGSTEMISILLTAGAKPNVANKKGHTALFFANGAGKPDVTALLEGAGAKYSRKDQTILAQNAKAEAAREKVYEREREKALAENTRRQKAKADACFSSCRAKSSDEQVRRGCYVLCRLE